MRYIKLTTKYMVKNILFLFLIALIPSIFMGSVLSPFKFLEFINGYTQITVTGFSSIFYSIVDISWLKILFYVLAYALISVAVSIILGQIENHFRSGKKNFSNVKNYINNNILTVFFALLLLSLIGLLVSLISSTIIYLFHIVINGLNTTPNTITVIIAIVVFVLYFCVMSIVSTILYLNIPNMLNNGYNFKQSISSTINYVGKNFLNVMLAYLLPYAIIILLVSIFNFSNIALHIINIICVLISIMYYSSFVMTTYFDLCGMQRYDERKYYIK